MENKIEGAQACLKVPSIFILRIWKLAKEMSMKLFKSALEKEWAKLEKDEAFFLEKALHKETSKLNQFLETKVPDGLQKTLDEAFAKAFGLVFEKGTGIIEKSYKKDEIERDYEINSYVVNRKEKIHSEIICVRIVRRILLEYVEKMTRMLSMQSYRILW